MVTENTNTVWNCSLCGLPACQDRYGHWVHYAPNPHCISGTVAVTALVLPVITRLLPA